MNKRALEAAKLAHVQIACALGFGSGMVTTKGYVCPILDTSCDHVHVSAVRHLYQAI